MGNRDKRGREKRKPKKQTAKRTTKLPTPIRAPDEEKPAAPSQRAPSIAPTELP